MVGAELNGEGERERLALRLRLRLRPRASWFFFFGCSFSSSTFSFEPNIDASLEVEVAAADGFGEATAGFDVLGEVSLAAAAAVAAGGCFGFDLSIDASPKSSSEYPLSLLNPPSRAFATMLLSFDATDVAAAGFFAGAVATFAVAFGVWASNGSSMPSAESLMSS